jgi:hypothetical protein
LLYTAGRTSLGLEQIAAKLTPVLADGLGPFEKAGLLGDTVMLLASHD